MTASPPDPNDLSLGELFARLVEPRWTSALIDQARAEDLGAGGDVTSRWCIDEAHTAEAVMRSRQPGRLAGMKLVGLIASRYDPALSVRLERHDGDAVAEGDPVAAFAGPMRSLLAAERVMLNMVCHLSGIATLTARYVDAVAGTRAEILDTRKTIPGYRGLAKYAVRCGGGRCHRLGLYDAVLIKDNHLAHVAGGDLATKLEAVIEAARRRDPAPRFVEVEVDRLEQFKEVLRCDVDIVLLDNLPPAALGEAVTLRDAAGHRALLEASGGVNLQTVRAMAEAGVDRIAIGAVTHSAPALDLGLDVAGD